MSKWRKITITKVLLDIKHLHFVQMILGRSQLPSARQRAVGMWRWQKPSEHWQRTTAWMSQCDLRRPIKWAFSTAGGVPHNTVKNDQIRSLGAVFAQDTSTSRSISHQSEDAYGAKILPTLLSLIMHLFSKADQLQSPFKTPKNNPQLFSVCCLQMAALLL